jgi:predicted transcriptional regulator of viral defense system
MAVSETEPIMRKDAEWMVKADDRILELIDEHGNLTPQAIEDLGGPSHARNRCPKLAKAGLLTRISRGLYAITDDGEAYLRQELDASELPNPDD